ILVRSLVGFVLPIGTQILIDDILPTKDYDTLKILLIAIVGALLIQAISGYVLTKILSVEAQHLISILRTKVQQKLMKLPINFFDNNKSGALVSRVMSDVE